MESNPMVALYARLLRLVVPFVRKDAFGAGKTMTLQVREIAEAHQKIVGMLLEVRSARAETRHNRERAEEVLHEVMRHVVYLQETTTNLHSISSLQAYRLDDWFGSRSDSSSRASPIFISHRRGEASDDDELLLAASKVMPPEEVTEWLKKPLVWLNGKSPRELMRIEGGRKTVIDYLHQVEHGVYT